MEGFRPVYRRWIDQAKDAAATKANKECKTPEDVSKLQMLDFCAFQSTKDDYDIFDDYNEMMTQFGYITLFGVVNPLVPMICICNNIVEAKSDLLKIVMQVKRPTPKAANHIGKAWKNILLTMSFYGILTNLMLLCLTSVSLDCLFNGQTLGKEGLEAAIKENGCIFTDDNSIVEGFKWHYDTNTTIPVGTVDYASGNCYCANLNMESKLWVVLIGGVLGLVLKSIALTVVSPVAKKTAEEIEREEFVKNFVFNQQAAAGKEAGKTA